MSGDTREIKLVLLGESSVGKTSLVVRFVNNHFKNVAESTIGASFMSKTIVVDDNAIKFQIWDTAGQERYRGLAPMYYRGAAAAIIVYDITSKHSFSVLKDWITELQTMGPPEIVIAIAANKSDLEDEREVDSDEGEEYASSVGALFAETSAKEDTNVTELFREISRRLPPEEAQPRVRSSLQLIHHHDSSKKGSKCC
eukprot:GCRY01003501.1.p1 GENE.GCRY01003501.1~~GCRY01003501.1.p1  ORF type:complete len:198 (-),score=31.46 GCRY01003501.1:333-926(-)